MLIFAWGFFECHIEDDQGPTFFSPYWIQSRKLSSLWMRNVVVEWFEMDDRGFNQWKKVRVPSLNFELKKRRDCFNLNSIHE